MKSLLVITRSVIAGAILSVLVDWLIKQSLPEKPEAKHRIVVFVLVFILVLVIAKAITSQSNDPQVSPPTMIAVSQVPTVSPTQPISTNSPTPMETLSPSPTLTLGEAHPLKVGDYFIYAVRNYDYPKNYEERLEVTGVELVESYQTWVIARTVKNMSPSMQENITAQYGTLWIDQNSGVMIKSESYTIYAKEQAFGLENGQVVQATKSTTKTFFNLDRNTGEQNISVIDTSGQEHLSTHRTITGDSIFVFRITRNVQLGERYPSKTFNPGPTVTKEETVSSASSTFDCWVIRWDYSEFYILSFFDKSTGMLVKTESWRNNSGTWEMVFEQSLLSYKFDNK